MARPLAPMTAKIESFIRMEARGEDPNDILRKVFHLDPETCSHEEKNKAFQQMWRWRHRPDAQAIWDDEVKAVVKLYSFGRQRISRKLHGLRLNFIFRLVDLGFVKLGVALTAFFDL